MDSNQASNPQPFAVTGYYDKPFQPVNELRYAKDKDFLADMNEMVDILSYNGRSGVESKADVLFRLILLIEMYATDYAKPGAPDKWANHPVETLLNLLYPKTTLAQDQFKEFVEALKGQEPLQSK